jgi:hypothetical protein
LQLQHEKRVTPKFGSTHKRRLPKAFYPQGAGAPRMGTMSAYGFSGP